MLTSDRINSPEPSGIVSLFADVLVISGMRAGDSNHYHPHFLCVTRSHKPPHGQTSIRVIVAL